MKNFASLHPSVNFIFYISALFFGMFLKHPVFLLLSFFAFFTYSIVLSGTKAIKILFLLYIPIVLFASSVNALTAHYGVTVLVALGGNNICLEPIVYGAVTGLSVISVMMLFSCYNKTVSSDKLMLLLGRKMPKIALIINMALRFVPLYSKKLADISAAQKGLGKGFAGGTLKEKIKSSGDMISALISTALEGAVDTADSMKSRGYGIKDRSHYSPYRFTPTDGVITAILLLCDAVVAVGIIRGEAYVLYNPYFYINTVTHFSLFVYTAYFMLLMMPVYLDLKERIKWKILKSKI